MNELVTLRCRFFGGVLSEVDGGATLAELWGTGVFLFREPFFVAFGCAAMLVTLVPKNLVMVAVPTAPAPLLKGL